MSVPDGGLNTTAAVLHGTGPPTWTEAVAPAHGWDLAFAYAVSLLSWLHLLLPLGSLLCAVLIALTGVWLYLCYQEGVDLLLMPVLIPCYICARLYSYRRDMRTVLRLNPQVRGGYLGLITGLQHHRALLETLDSIGVRLDTSCTLRYLLCMVSWQEALGLLCLLGWAVAALTPNMWTCFPGGDTLAWLGMQLALTLEGERLGGSGQHIIAALFYAFCLSYWPGELLKRRRELLSRRKHKRFMHYMAEEAKERQKERQEQAAAGNGNACNAIALETNSKPAPAKPPRLRPAPDETLLERLGLPALTSTELLRIAGFAFAVMVGGAWLIDPAGPTSYWLCKYTSWCWNLSWSTMALYLGVPLLVVAVIVSQAQIVKEWSEWDATYRAHKYDLRVSMPDVSAGKRDEIARCRTERTHGQEPSCMPLILAWCSSFLRWSTGMWMGFALVVWALRPGYLPAQVVGAWPWQGPQLLVGAAAGGSAPVCYEPGRFDVVNHLVGVPSVPALWQAALVSVRELSLSSAATDIKLPPDAQQALKCMPGDAGQDIERLGVCSSERQPPVAAPLGPPPLPPLVAGEPHAAVRLSWDTVHDVQRIDWGGYLARAARVNLLAARVWRHSGLEGMQRAFNALGALQTPGVNVTRAAAALKELRRLQLPVAAPAATGGRGSGSGAGPGKRQGTERRKAEEPDQDKGRGALEQEDMVALALALATLLLQLWQQHLLELGLAALATLLLLALLANAKRLAAALKKAVAGKKAAGAPGAKRTLSGKPKGKQQQAQVERQGSGKQPQSRQQEQKRDARGGKGASGAEKQQQERQAKTPTDVSQVATGPKQQQDGARAAGEAARQEASAAGAKGKGGPVRQPTAVPSPSNKTPRDRQRDSEAKEAAGGDKGTAGHQAKKQQQWPQQQKEKQGAAAQPPPRTGHTVPASDAVAALFPFTAELASSSSSRSKAAASGDSSHHQAPPAMPAAAFSQHAARPSSFFNPAAPAQAPPQPAPAAPRPAPVPVNPRTVRPASFVGIMGGRIHAVPQPPSSTATAFSSSAPSSHPPVPVPIPVISSTSSGPTPPAAGPRLIPHGPNGMPASPPAAAPASAAPAPSPMGLFGFNPALAKYFMGRVAPTANEQTAAQAGGASNSSDAKQQQGSAAAAAEGEGAAAGPAANPYKCIRCRTGGRQVGFLHGDSAHVCLCRGCSSALGLRDGDPCPQCGVPCVRVLNIF